MKTTLLAMALTVATGMLQAEVAWKWDDSNRPADTVATVEQTVSGTFESASPNAVEKRGISSAFTFFTAFFDGSIFSDSVAVNGNLIKRLIVIIR